MRIPLTGPSSGSNKRVARELFKNRAYDELRSRLFSNQYGPGSFLSERQLAAELGMSKTPIKAALERLEMEGFIIVSPQSGIVVCELSQKEIADLYEIRIALEGYVLQAITGRLTISQYQEWDANLKAQAQNPPSPENRLQSVALDAQFHMLPSQFLGNQQIIKTMQQMYDKMQVVINRVFALTPERAAQSIHEHLEIVDAVKSGNGRRASELVETHLLLGHKILCEATLQ